MRLTRDQYIERFFEYHAPKGDQPDRYGAINASCRATAEVIFDCCPESPERTLALRCLEDCRMRANQSIAVNELGE